MGKEFNPEKLKVKIEMELNVDDAQTLMVFANVISTRKRGGYVDIGAVYSALSDIMCLDFCIDVATKNGLDDVHSMEMMSLGVVYEAITGNNEDPRWEKRARDFIDWRNDK